MPTSDERRRVAQALREMGTPAWPTLTDAVMGHPAMRKKVVERLAELVDPTADVLLHTKVGAVICGACGHIVLARRRRAGLLPGMRGADDEGGGRWRPIARSTALRRR